jgi:hypothetical protein
MQQERGKSKLCYLVVAAFILCDGVVAQQTGALQLKPDPETDLVLPKVTLRQFGSDDVTVTLGFYLPLNSDKTQPAKFSLGYSVDREKRTYRIFDLWSILILTAWWYISGPAVQGIRLEFKK